MGKSDDTSVRFVGWGGHSAWGTQREQLADGTYLCQDASGGWYLDPETGETDVAWMTSTEWYSETYRRRYVESRLREGVPFAEWDRRGRNEWINHAVERGWARPAGAPSPRKKATKRAQTGPASEREEGS
jgi:hypothetical protein